MKSVDRLQQYLQGNLSEAELDEQTRELARAYFADADRKEKWGELLENNPEWQAFRASQKPTATSSTLASEPKRSYRWLLPLIAVLLLLLAALFYWFAQGVPTPSRPQLVAEQLAVTHPYNNSRSTEESATDARQVAADHYQSENYAAAIVAWQSLYEVGSATVEDRFYLAQSYLYQENYSAAVALYEEILREERRLYQREAHWYLALAQLQLGQDERARQQLEFLSQQRGWKSAEADQLLQTWSD